MNSNIKKIIFIFLLSTFAFSYSLKAQVSYTGITKYDVYYGWALRDGQEILVTRKFDNAGKTYYLTVNPRTLDTKIDKAGIYAVNPITIADARERFKNTPYERALRKAEKKSIGIQDAGIEAGMPKQSGISLTVDLCPSHRPLDRQIFTGIFTEFQKVQYPVPVAISVTGVWMRQHPQDLEWLKTMQADSEINITWINHSFNHRVSATLPLKQNFLLEAGTDINYEVLETEKAMLKNAMLPSVFFRFPGLISDQQLVYKITSYGLIPVGTDAWLAKGQKPQAGSIVLIHGNGNEPTGVTDFIKLLHSKTLKIAKKQWLLYDLRQSLNHEFADEK